MSYLVGVSGLNRRLISTTVSDIRSANGISTRRPLAESRLINPGERSCTARQ